jgi:hypothetical protein
LIVHESISHDSPTLVSDIVQFNSEFRFFVKENKIQTGSCYIKGQEITNDWGYSVWRIQPVLQELLDWKMISSEDAVIDMGILDGGAIVPIESNPVWASGIYGCDPYYVLKTMENSCELI